MRRMAFPDGIYYRVETAYLLLYAAGALALVRLSSRDTFGIHG